MANKKTNNINDTIDKIYLPDYIQGYEIKREFGSKKIENCLKELVSLHANK